MFDGTRLILALTTASVLAACGSSPETTTSTAPKATSTAAKGASAPALGKVDSPAGAVSGIEYTVTAVKTGKTIGDQENGVTKARQGRFIVVTLALRNTTKASYTFAAPQTVWVTTKNGRRYDPATEIGTSLGDADLFSAQLAPGETRTGKLAFDLPAAELPGAVLHVEEELIDDKHKLAIDLGL